MRGLQPAGGWCARRSAEVGSAAACRSAASAWVVIGMRECEACGREFESSSKRARFCRDAECKRVRARERKRKQLGIVLPLPDSPSDQVPGASLLAATRKALEGAGQLESYAGQAALVLAEQLASDSRVDTGSSLASLAKEFRAAMADALKDAARADDGIDELRARRARRASVGG